MSTVENVDESVETVEGPSVINDELVRSLALKLDLFVKIGREVPLTNLKRSGYLADVVESLGWSEAERTIPEVGFFLGRLRARWRTSSPGRRERHRAPVSSARQPTPIGRSGVSRASMSSGVGRRPALPTS